MHGLMADRLLKRFLKGIRRKSKIAFAKETEPENEAEMIDKANPLENDRPQGKDEAQTIEKTAEISKQIHQNSGLDVTSGETRLPDDLQKKNEKGDLR